MSAAAEALPWEWLGRVEHGAAVELQERLRAEILAGERGGRLLLCEHEPVITLGRSAEGHNILGSPEALAARGVTVSRASRGGDVTYHGPGQLMVYPVMRIGRLVPYLEVIAGALARLAEALGVPGAHWRREPAGLWLGDAKLAACGIHVSRRIAIHGYAFNVATPPEPWQLIVPCGLSCARVTSIAEQRAARALPPPPPVEEVARLAAPLLVDALAAGGVV